MIVHDPHPTSPPRPARVPHLALPLRLALIALLPLAPATANALEFECRQPGDTRYLGVDLPGEEHLCEVSVHGGLGGERRVMWYADNQTLFCSAKAYELRDKYVENWSFDCRRSPDRDGVDLLSPRHREILDAELKSLLAAAADGEPALGVTGVRAVASSSPTGEPSLLALQFFLAGGGDLVRVLADEDGRWRTFAETRNLAERLPVQDGLRVDDAFIAAIDEDGAVDVVTLLERDGASTCEGRSSLQVDGDGSLVPLSPHRHVCGDAGPLPGDDG